MSPHVITKQANTTSSLACVHNEKEAEEFFLRLLIFYYEINTLVLSLYHSKSGSAFLYVLGTKEKSSSFSYKPSNLLFFVILFPYFQYNQDICPRQRIGKCIFLGESKKQKNGGFSYEFRNAFLLSSSRSISTFCAAFALT